MYGNKKNRNLKPEDFPVYDLMNDHFYKTLFLNALETEKPIIIGLPIRSELNHLWEITQQKSKPFSRDFKIMILKSNQYNMGSFITVFISRPKSAKYIPVTPLKGKY